jgi:hypothetical protein
MGEPTARAASASIVFEPVGEQQLKGKAVPVPALRALRVVAERGGRRRADQLEAPFVGRDDELRLLKDLFHATEREGRARLVSVVGPAGIGKSRLAWEFEKYLDGIVGTVWWHHGRAPAYGDGMTFWSLGEMIRGRMGLAETDDERTTRRRITETLQKHLTDESERTWIEPAMLALLGIETGTAAPEQLFAAWRTFFERLSADGSVVFVFEDLHWADPGTLDFIDRSSRSDDRTGARASATSPASTWSRSRSPRCACCSPDSRRACRRPRCAPSSPGRTACRSTPWRPSGCWSRTAGWCRRATATSRSAT